MGLIVIAFDFIFKEAGAIQPGVDCLTDYPSVAALSIFSMLSVT